MSTKESVDQIMRESRERRMHRTSWLMIAALANHACCTPDQIIDWLTGMLWDEQEAHAIKNAAI